MSLIYIGQKNDKSSIIKYFHAHIWKECGFVIICDNDSKLYYQEIPQNGVIIQENSEEAIQIISHLTTALGKNLQMTSYVITIPKPFISRCFVTPSRVLSNHVSSMVTKMLATATQNTHNNDSDIISLTENDCINNFAAITTHMSKN